MSVLNDKEIKELRLEYESILDDEEDIQLLDIQNLLNTITADRERIKRLREGIQEAIKDIEETSYEDLVESALDILQALAGPEEVN